MTLPALTAAYRKKVVETELKKSYTLLNQLIRRSEADNESATTWDWGSKEENDRVFINQIFDKYFAPYLNIIDRITDIRYYKVYSAAGEGPSWMQSNNRNADWIRLADGRVVKLGIWETEGINYGSWDVIISTGAKKERLVSGRDLFTFSINIDKNNSSVSIFPNSYKNWNCKYLEENRSDFINKCRELEGNTSGNYPESYCTMLIYCNDWKIPEDYPVKI